ncbi:HNH endonuclease [Candidatus Roizmanbacteria bacterium]|nr:HNH endonuclease [Candidatus Roizmanbacteria bacterium]
MIYFGKSGADGAISDDLIRFRKLHRGDYASDLLEDRFTPRNTTRDAPEEKKITLTDVYSYVSSLQEAVETWYKMWNPFDSDFPSEIKLWLDKINRLPTSFFQPLVLMFLQTEQSEMNRIAFLRAIERQLFIMLLARDRYGFPFPLDYSVDSYQLAIDLRVGKLSAEKVTKHITDKTSSWLKKADFIQEIIVRFRSEGFYEWEGIRYFLFEHNLELQRRSKTDRPKIFWPEFTESKTDYVSVEHIFPRQARHEYWTSRFKGLTQKQKETLRDSLGNLLPLSKPKNSSLSNKPFPDKVDGKQDPAVGYRYGCYAENDVAKEKEWTPEAIFQRGLRMLDFMERRWDIEIGDEKQKKTMLGLDFMK